MHQLIASSSAVTVCLLFRAEVCLFLQATGVDINVQFTDIDKFEFTDEVAIFDLLGIPLVHGWLVDPQARLHLPLQLRRPIRFSALCSACAPSLPMLAGAQCWGAVRRRNGCGLCGASLAAIVVECSGMVATTVPGQQSLQRCNRFRLLCSGRI